MNKFDIIKSLAESVRFQKGKNSNFRLAKIAVETIVEAMKNALMKNERIEIRGFGSFTVRHYNAYKGKNPKTKEPIYVKPKRLPYFRVGKELRERLLEEFKKGT